MIYQPVKQVFDFVSQPENDFQWQYGTLASARLSENIDNRLGTFFRSLGHLLGRRNLSTFEVVDYELNKKYGFKSLSGPFYSQTTYTFTTENGGTRINISIRAHVVNFHQVSERSMEKLIKEQLTENLALLKKLLETNVANRETYPLAA